MPEALLSVGTTATVRWRERGWKSLGSQEFRQLVSSRLHLRGSRMVFPGTSRPRWPPAPTTSGADDSRPFRPAAAPGLAPVAGPPPLGPPTGRHGLRRLVCRLAETLGTTLATADSRLASAPGLDCETDLMARTLGDHEHRHRTTGLRAVQCLSRGPPWRTPVTAQGGAQAGRAC